MLWLTPEFQSLEQVLDTTQAAVEHSSVEEEAITISSVTTQELQVVLSSFRQSVRDRRAPFIWDTNPS